MVRLLPPPPARPPDPLFQTLPAGTTLFRLFDPTRHGATAAGFRHYGPLARFDHHRGMGAGPAGERLPAQDPERGILYAAATLSSCLVEIFGDTGLIAYGNWHVAAPTLTRELLLLDLRGPGAMRAGAVAALAKIPERPPTQQWSRYFYEETATYAAPDGRPIDGLLYYNAHNDEEAVALYERAAAVLACLPDRVARLDTREPTIRAALLEAAERNHLVFEEP